MGLENRYCLVQACAGLAPFSPEMLQAGAVKGPAQTVPKKKKRKKKKIGLLCLGSKFSK